MKAGKKIKKLECAKRKQEKQEKWKKNNVYNKYKIFPRSSVRDEIKPRNCATMRNGFINILRINNIIYVYYNQRKKWLYSLF